jgi:hypothetical protein
VLWESRADKKQRVRNQQRERRAPKSNKRNNRDDDEHGNWNIGKTAEAHTFEVTHNTRKKGFTSTHTFMRTQGGLFCRPKCRKQRKRAWIRLRKQS